MSLTNCTWSNPDEICVQLKLSDCSTFSCPEHVLSKAPGDCLIFSCFAVVLLIVCFAGICTTLATRLPGRLNQLID